MKVHTKNILYKEENYIVSNVTFLTPPPHPTPHFTDYVNCKEFNTDNDLDAAGIGQLIFERLSLNYHEPLQCLVDTVLYYPRLLIESVINQFWIS